MPYNETFEKLKAAQNPAFAEEIEAVKDNQTFFIGAYESSSEGNIPKGDFNEIFQALLNNDKALKILAEAIQARTITAGKGLQGGGNLTTNRTIDVVSADDSITVDTDNIKVNTYNGVDSTSTTRPGSANAVKIAYDKGKEGLDKADTKLDAGSVSVDYNTGRKIEDKIKEKLDKTAIVNDLTTGGADKAGSAEMVKKLGEDKQNKTDNNLLVNKESLVKAVNNSYRRILPEALPLDIKDLNNITDIHKTYAIFNRDDILNSPPLSDYILVGYAPFLSDTQNPTIYRHIAYQRDGNKIYTRSFTTSWSRWVEILSEDSNLFLGVIGVGRIVFIQDSGTKTAGGVYFDSATGRPYYCINTTESVTVDGNFELCSLGTNRKLVRNIVSFDNGQYKGLEIKAKTLNKTEAQMKVTFDTPFKNKCLAVVLTDVVDSGLGYANQAILQNTITKNGFTYVSSQSINEAFSYLAIGY